MFDRRRVVVGGALIGLMGWPGAACAQWRPALAPEDFGAAGDGRTDDTQALQRCIDAAGEGGTIRLRQGAVYRVDSNYRPTWERFGGLRLRSGQVLQLNGGELKALPSTERHGAVVQAFGSHGWRIEGPGTITGERDVHRGSGGEWGMGVAAFAADDWSVGPGVRINNCWGDGIYVGGQHDVGEFCHRFTIEGVEIFNCRRNGISVVAGRDAEIRRAHIHHISGTGPEGGIDLEPDDPRLPNRNITIRDGRIHDTPVGIFVTVANQNVLVTGMDISCSNSGIIFSDRSVGLSIVRNRIESTRGGEEGAAVRSVTGLPHTIRSVHIQHNELLGGGFYILDILGRGYVDLVISHNRIRVSNRRARGIARLDGGQFTDNVGVVEPHAGWGPDEYLLILDGVSHGRNHFRNLSAYPLPLVIRETSRDLGGNSYPPPRR